MQQTKQTEQIEQTIKTKKTKQQKIAKTDKIAKQINTTNIAKVETVETDETKDTLTPVKTNDKQTPTKTNDKSMLVNIFKNCLNILRDNEGLTGDKALRNMTYLLTLKSIEQHFGKEIDIDNYEYDFSHIVENDIEQHKKILLETAHFSNLVNEKEENIPNRLKCLWEDILSNHPSTKNVFLKNKGFDIQHQSTYKKLIDKINTLPNTEIDILGSAYEEVTQDIMKGKVLGQFFTQPSIKKMMVKLIDPQIHADGKIDTCCDPTMGTGGFLTTYLKYVLQPEKLKNTKIDWNFIRTDGLYGKEIEPDTYQLAVANMLISSGHMFEKLDKGDSIREPITKKFDCVLANPPFGIKGLKYDDFKYELKDEYIPIKTDNAVSLFIQAIIYILKIDGKCAVVLPDGQDLFSKTNTTLIMIREYLMKTCDLQEIIYVPSGMFDHTPIKTCVFFFIKKKETTEVLEITYKTSKTLKTDKKYKMIETFQTTKVKFYDYDFDKDEKKLLIEVPIEKIKNNFYSLNYAEYIANENKEEYNKDVVVKTLGEVCEINYGTRIVRNKNIDGEYEVYGSGRATSTTNKFNREGFTILIGRFALSPECVRFINKKIFLNDSGLSIKSKTDILLQKYVGYYLFHNQHIIYNCARGTAQKNLEIDIFKLIKIPIPSLEQQQEIVKYLDFIYEKANKTSNDKINELKMLNEYCINMQKMSKENTTKKIFDLCVFIKTGKNKPIDNKTGTLYPYYGTGAITGYTDEYLYDGQYILTARNGTIGNCFLTDGKFFPSDHVFIINIADKCLMKYIYYILKNNKELDNLKTGVGIPNITKEILGNLKILIPTLERQKEIVEYCEQNDTLIKQLEKEIENNKKQAQQFIINMLKLQTVTQNKEEINENDDKDENEDENKNNKENEK